MTTLDGSDVPDATQTSLGSAYGPYNYDVYSYSSNGCSLNIPQSALSSLPTLREISFNIKLMSLNQDKELLKIMSPSGHYFKLMQQGSLLTYEATFATTSSSQAPDVSVNLTPDPIPLDSWLTFRCSVGLQNLLNSQAMKYGLNSTLQPLTRTFADFSLGDVQVSNFDGALSCLTLSSDANGDDAILAQTACFSSGKFIITACLSSGKSMITAC